MAGPLGTKSPGMLAERLWRAVDDPGGPRRRLLEAARRADRAIGYQSPAAEVGHDFIRHCDGHDFPQPVHPGSEAARDARRLAESRPPARPAWSFSPTLALGAAPPGVVGPEVPPEVPPPAPAPMPHRPRGHGAKHTPEQLRAQLDLLRSRSRAAQGEPSAAALQKPAADGREQAR
jgi:hypothetical protein